MNGLMGFQGYAKGAIKTKEELLDVIIEARKGKKAIRLYRVSQGGYLEELFITSKVKITAERGSPLFPAWGKSAAGGKPYRTYYCLGDSNIACNGRQGGHNRHQMFVNRRHAEEYSAQLKNDTAYQQAIKDFHRSMDRLFGRLF